MTAVPSSELCSNEAARRIQLQMDSFFSAEQCSAVGLPAPKRVGEERFGWSQAVAQRSGVYREVPGVRLMAVPSSEFERRIPLRMNSFVSPERCSAVALVARKPEEVRFAWSQAVAQTIGAYREVLGCA